MPTAPARAPCTAARSPTPSALAQGRRTVVVLPASEVTLAEPELPPVRGAARIAQAVPFALEEQLASDIERCISPSVRAMPASSATPVAIVARAVARTLARPVWDAAGIQPDAAYAESSLIPVRAECAGAGARRGDAVRQPPGTRRRMRSMRSRCRRRSTSRSAQAAEPAST